MQSSNPHIRNIAIIAHVDHGKTTLVDQLLRQSGAFHSRQAVTERVMDSMDLERERGITIRAKNCSILWEDTKINILDTPGHADFGGEVERALSMVDGAILLVDAAEGPLPQTRFVLRKALEAKLKIIIVINKIDRKDARPEEVLSQVYDLLIDLEGDESYLDSPVVWAIGRNGVAQESLNEPKKDLSHLFNLILKHIPAPTFDTDQPFQMLVSNLAYSDFLGRLAVGRVHHGSVKKNEPLVCIGKQATVPLRVMKLQVYEGVIFKEIETIEPGEIVILAGVDDVEIGDTICHKNFPKALPRLRVDEPTISMRFYINTSPLAGQEGEIVQARKIFERLNKETLNNVALRLEGRIEDESFILKGRGEFQMAILIEQMRREGFELNVGRPQIIFKEENGKQLEPIENVVIDCDDTSIGIVTEKLSSRKAKMMNMVNHGTGRVRLEFSVPSRGLIGYRGDFLTDTRGTGLINAYLAGYEEFRGDIFSRRNGSLVADRTGQAIPYAIFHIQPRGQLFVKPGDVVYEGMIVGEHSRENDLDVNICREKKLTNIRAANRDENIILTPPVELTLEKALDFIRDDELLEVTPINIRLRKRVLAVNKR